MANNHDLFNKKFIEMLEDLVLVLGHECPDQVAQFEGFKVFTNTCILVDKSSPQQLFNRSVCIPYEKYIIEKDEAFFLNKTYDTKEPLVNGMDNSSLIDKLKSVWRKLDNNNKETMWKYMQVLVALNRRCLSA